MTVRWKELGGRTLWGMGMGLLVMLAQSFGVVWTSSGSEEASTGTWTGVPEMFGPRSAAAQEDPLEVEGIRVVGTRAGGELPLRTRSVTVLDREAIEALPARSVPDLLRWVPGVEAMDRSPAQADVSIRGAGFEQLLVLLDGVPISDRQTGHFDMNLPVSLDRVERVEVLRGSASAVYGADAVGGVINLVTRGSQDLGPQDAIERDASLGTRRDWGLRAEGGSFGTMGASATGGVTTSLAGRAMDVAGGLAYGRSDGHRAGTDYETLTGDASAATVLGSGLLTGHVGHTQRDFGAEDFYAPFPSYEAVRATAVHLGWEGAPEPGFSLEPRVAFRRHEDDFLVDREAPDGDRNVHRSTQAGGELVATYRSGGNDGAAGPDRSVALGLEAYRDRLESTNLGTRSEDRGALFLEGALGGMVTPLGDLSVSLGMRADRHDGFGSVLSPSVSLAVEPSGDFRVRGAAGRSFRAPSWTERYYTDPAHDARSDLRAERSWSGELGVDVRPGGGLILRMDGFHRDARDLVDWARPAGSGDDVMWESRNVQRTRVRGVELEATHVGALGLRWSLAGTFLSLRAEDQGAYESKQVLRPLGEEVVATVGRGLGPFDVEIQGLHGRRHAGEAFQRMDGRVTLAVRGADVHLDVRNALDAEYPDLMGHPEITGHPAPGRSLTLGLAF